MQILRMLQLSSQRDPFLQSNMTLSFWIDWNAYHPEERQGSTNDYISITTSWYRFCSSFTFVWHCYAKMKRQSLHHDTVLFHHFEMAMVEWCKEENISEWLLHDSCRKVCKKMLKKLINLEDKNNWTAHISTKLSHREEGKGFLFFVFYCPGEHFTIMG